MCKYATSLIKIVQITERAKNFNSYAKSYRDTGRHFLLSQYAETHWVVKLKIDLSIEKNQVVGEDVQEFTIAWHDLNRIYMELKVHVEVVRSPVQCKLPIVNEWKCIEIVYWRIFSA